MKQSILKLGLVVILGIIGCRSYSEGIMGNYKSKEYNYVTQNFLSFFKNTTFVLRSSLKINADSTYILDNCGNVEKGNWQVRNDSLLLYCKENRIRSDSSNKTGKDYEFINCGDDPNIFIIDKNELRQEWKSKGTVVLNYFEKCD